MLWFVFAFWLAVVDLAFPVILESLLDATFETAIEPGDCEVTLDEDGDRVPRLRIPPAYPPVALQNGIEGRVLLEGTIARDGTVQNGFVVASEPPGEFDEAALAAFVDWEYCPLSQEADHSEEPFRIVIPFRITDE